jgi:hypothetical protein
MHITKNFLKSRAVVSSCKNFLLRAAAGPHSCKKIRGNIDVMCLWYIPLRRPRLFMSCKADNDDDDDDDNGIPL